MDALDLHFPDGSFDVVLCLQNGICAFGVDQESLLREALRVTRAGGVDGEVVEVDGSSVACEVRKAGAFRTAASA